MKTTIKQDVELLPPASEERRFNNLKPLNVPYGSKEAASESPFTVVNTEACGKRITIGKPVMGHLGSPETIQILTDKDGIVISKALSEDATSFRLRKSGKKSCVYSSNLVDTLTEEFNLDFSNRTSISFQDVEYLNFEGEPVAFVLLRQAAQTTQQDTAEPVPEKAEEEASLPTKVPLQEAADTDEADPPEQEAFEE